VLFLATPTSTLQAPPHVKFIFHGVLSTTARVVCACVIQPKIVLRGHRERISASFLDSRKKQMLHPRENRKKCKRKMCASYKRSVMCVWRKKQGGGIRDQRPRLRSPRPLQRCDHTYRRKPTNACNHGAECHDVTRRRMPHLTTTRRAVDVVDSCLRSRCCSHIRSKFLTEHCHVFPSLIHDVGAHERPLVATLKSLERGE
jgi:hypothetical protein